MKKELGKIETIYVGHGGYQDSQIGLHITFSGKGWGVSTFIGTLDPEIISCDEHCKWSEEDRNRALMQTMRKISTLLNQAKVHTVSDLKNIPVEITFEDQTLKDWNILEEVL